MNKRAWIPAGDQITCVSCCYQRPAAQLLPAGQCGMHTAAAGMLAQLLLHVPHKSGTSQAI
jgi:hypothetical protein